jgi:RNA polymerase primary sigma factor
MASKTEETLQKEEMPEREGPETLPDDLSDAAVKKLIRSAKKRGYVTHDQIDSVLPSEEVNSEQIEDVLAMFSEMGVNVVETEEPSEEGEGPREEADEEGEGESESGELVEVQQKVPAKSEAKEPTERTDDPVRMYLREMSSVELLSREGEIAIAKRIEAGREAMIAGLCESPLTFQAIIIWRDELNEGKVCLRDIIDLEATYAGPDAKAMLAPVIGPDGQPIVAAGAQAAAGSASVLAQTPAPPAAPAAVTPFKGAAERDTGEEGEGGEATPSEVDFDDDDMENSLSLAAIEAELKPKVLETFDNIADAYKRLRRLQDQDIQNKLRNDSLSPAQERRYKKLKDEIISEVKSLRLNQARIDAQQLWCAPKRGKLIATPLGKSMLSDTKQGALLAA